MDMASYIDKMFKLADSIIDSVSKTVATKGERRNYYFRRLSLKQEMIKAGYSPKTAEQPARVMQTKTFREILAERITGNEMVNVQQSNLTAMTLEIIKVPTSTQEADMEVLAEKMHGEFAMFGMPFRGAKEAYILVPHHKVRDLALDKLYKLTGEYAPEKHAVITRPFDALSNEELEEKIKEAEKRVVKEG